MRRPTHHQFLRASNVLLWLIEDNLGNPPLTHAIEDTNAALLRAYHRHFGDGVPHGRPRRRPIT